MYPNNDKISIGQLVNILVLSLIGTGILTLPRDLAEMVGTDGWLVLLAGGIFVMGISYFHGYIIELFPGKALFEILTFTLKKPLAYLLSIFLCIHLLGNAAYVVRIYKTVIKTVLLPRTPGPVIIGMMLLTVIYLVRVGIEPMGRLSNMLFPVSVIMVTILFALTLGDADFSNLRPFLQTPAIRILKSSNVAVFSFLGFELLLIFGVNLNMPERAKKIGPIAIGLVLIFYLLLNMLVLANFGVTQITSLIWPTFNVFKNVEFPGAFIENIELLAMSIWIFTIFMTLAPIYLGAIILISDILDAREFNYLALPILPIVYFIAIYSEGIAEVQGKFTVFSKYTAYPTIIGIPFLILMGRQFKKLFKGKRVKD